MTMPKDPIKAAEYRKKLSEIAKRQKTPEWRENRKRWAERYYSVKENRDKMRRHHSEETKRKIAEIRRGSHHSEETKHKMSVSHKGIKRSEETRKRMSEYAKNMTPEHRKHLSEAVRNRKRNFTSKGEKEMTAFIKGAYDGEVLENYRKLFPGKGYELDVYLPELGLAFEYNGDYFHGPEHPENVVKDFWKQEHAKDLDVQLYFIWESDWTNKREECESFILDQLHK